MLLLLLLMIASLYSAVLRSRANKKGAGIAQWLEHRTRD